MTEIYLTMKHCQVEGACVHAVHEGQRCHRCDGEIGSLPGLPQAIAEYVVTSRAICAGDASLNLSQIK